MKNKRKGEFAPYEMMIPGFEATYMGQRNMTAIDTSDANLSFIKDNLGNVIEQWPTWNFAKGEEDWDEKIKYINKIQEKLGFLDDKTRKIRAHIASLTPCDSGIPVTIDELLFAIGKGELSELSFRNGCWHCGGTRSTQPSQKESMRLFTEVLTGYLAGKRKQEFIKEFPDAEGFISRTYEWLGPVTELTKVQKLLMERMMLPFEFFTKASHAHPRSTWPEGAEEACQVAMQVCYEEGGRGAQIDAKIAALAGLPKISMKYPDQARTARIDDPEKKDLYILCCALAHGLHTLGDCHHSTFRWIENWLYSIGTGKWGIPTRKMGTERERLGHLLFGYSLGLDKWLLDKPMQFLLLDLGHVDLGFDPKNEILRVYAYLGEERSPVKL